MLLRTLCLAGLVVAGLGVTDLAREHYIELGGEPIHVQLYFNSTCIDKRRRKSVAKAIAELVFRYQQSSDSQIEWENHGDCPSDLGCLSFFLARRIGSSKNSWSSPRRVGSMRVLSDR